MGENLETHGWNYITKTFEKIYPNQDNPLHFGTAVPWSLGGKDPLQGISIYDGGDYYHFVTYGFSEIYEKESKNKEYSGFGFELTLKLKKNPNIDDNELKCVAGILQAIGRITFEDGDIYHPNEYIYTGQTSGMDSKGASKITGFITTLDEAKEIDTPNGKLQFVQLIGMTDKELKQIIDKKLTVEELFSKLSNTLTDYTRDDIILE